MGKRERGRVERERIPEGVPAGLGLYVLSVVRALVHESLHIFSAATLSGHSGPCARQLPTNPLGRAQCFTRPPIQAAVTKLWTRFL